MAGYVQLASAKLECHAPHSPDVVVSAKESGIQYNNSRSQTELTRMETDTVSPYARNVRTHVGGLMNGEVSVAQNIRFYHETYSTVRAGCLYIDTVKVDITTRPTIYIAKNHRKGSCMYNAILEHEKKHVAADRELVAKYRSIIAKALESAVEDMGASHGPYPASKLSMYQDVLQKELQNVVHVYSAKLTEERKKKQQGIDTLEEYESVQAKCEGGV
jgi:hypothetical protein